MCIKNYEMCSIRVLNTRINRVNKMTNKKIMKSLMFYSLCCLPLNY